MKPPIRRVETAEESHAKFHQAKVRRSLMRRETKVLIVLAVVICGAVFLLYRAVFVLPAPPPPVPAHATGSASRYMGQDPASEALA